jgi:hypothetical protein
MQFSAGDRTKKGVTEKLHAKASKQEWLKTFQSYRRQLRTSNKTAG